MPQSSNVKVYKYKNIAAALAAVLIVLVAVSTSCSARIAEKRNEKASDESSIAADSGSEAEVPEDTLRLTKNYKYVEYKNGTTFNNGLLCTVDKNHSFSGSIMNSDALYGYMFDKNGNQVMSASTTILEGDVKMLKSFNQLCCDFGKKTGLYTLMVNTIQPEQGGEDPRYDEASMGTCLDLMIYDQARGIFDSFTTEGDYAWIAQNCYKYGFVLRGDSRLRYIGYAPAAYIKSENDKGGYDLERFLTDVKGYSFEKPLVFTDENNNDFAFYFVAVDGSNSTTNIPVPLRDDDSEFDYEISGNNDDGYIVCVDLFGNAAFDDYYESHAEESGNDDNVMIIE